MFNAVMLLVLLVAISAARTILVLPVLLLLNVNAAIGLIWGRPFNVARKFMLLEVVRSVGCMGCRVDWVRLSVEGCNGGDVKETMNSKRFLAGKTVLTVIDWGEGLGKWQK
nr:hypothetical protein [Tanacetum cinerariifolium]